MLLSKVLPILKQVSNISGLYFIRIEDDIFKVGLSGSAHNRLSNHSKSYNKSELIYFSSIPLSSRSVY